MGYTIHITEELTIASCLINKMNHENQSVVTLDEVRAFGGRLQQFFKNRGFDYVEVHSVNLKKEVEFHPDYFAICKDNRGEFIASKVSKDSLMNRFNGVGSELAYDLRNTLQASWTEITTPNEMRIVITVYKGSGKYYTSDEITHPHNIQIFEDEWKRFLWDHLPAKFSGGFVVVHDDPNAPVGHFHNALYRYEELIPHDEQ